MERNISKVEGILQSSGMITIKSNFRQEQTFLSSLPIMENNIDIKKASRRNVLSSGLIAT